MTKKLLYSIAIIAGLVSCKGDYDDWTTPQSNAANEAADKFNLQIVQTLYSIDFAGDNGDNVQIFTSNLQEGVAVTDGFDITLSDNGENPVQIQASADGKVSTSDFEKAVVKIFGNKPLERELEAEIHAYIAVTTADGVVNVDKTYIPIVLTAKPSAPFISTGYYLIGDMTNKWDSSAMIKFSHSGKDVYDDPVFTVLFETKANDQYWKIIPQSNIDSGDVWSEPENGTGVLGVAVDGDVSESGLLTTISPKAGKISEPAMYKMTINMMDYTYSIERVVPQFYLIGEVNGWNSGEKNSIFTPHSNTVYSFTTKWAGAWDLKFWGVADYGNWNNNSAYGCPVDGDNSPSGTLIQAGCGAIAAPSAEYYTFTIDLSTMSYTWTKLDEQNPTEYEAIGIIGDFNSWAKDFDLKQVAPHNWYGVTTVTDGGLKFRANHGWDINWGAELSVTEADYFAKGVANGSNIYVPAGTYAFYLNDITGDFAIVEQK